MRDFHFFLFVLLCSVTSAINSCTPAPKANEPAPEGFLTKNIKTVDSLVGAFMKKYNVPGLSFTIAKDDSIKIEHCYGYADIDKKELMRPASRFRIASISKPITATAIMQLVEQGKLHLQDKVLGKDAILGITYGAYPYKKWVEDITIEILLEHLGGGWGKDQDPVYLHPEMNQAQMIGWTLDNRPIGYEPGTHFLYSNFGYCLLGRVIEKVTGMKYEDWVRKNILDQCGITDMQIGGNSLAERLPREVHYYESKDDPYERFARNMDSFAGWVATPTDLVKFMMRVDKFQQKPDILQPATLDTMFATPAVSTGYAKGWMINKKDDYFHFGNVTGQTSFLARMHDGFCFAVIVNTRTGGNFQGDLDQLMYHIRLAISHWPHGEIR